MELDESLFNPPATEGGNNKIGAMMLTMLEAKKNSLGGLPGEQGKMLAMLKPKKKKYHPGTEITVNKMKRTAS